MKKHLLKMMILLLVLFPLAGQGENGVISTREQLVSYLTQAAASQPAEIPFEYASNLKENIADSSWMCEVMYDSGLMNARWSYSSTKCTFKEITYMPKHYQCKTEEEVLSALRSAEEGIVNLRLSTALYEKLTANNFEPLYNLEAKAGIDTRKMSYYKSSHLFLYSEVVYADHFFVVETESELEALMQTGRESGRSALTILCAPELYAYLSANDFEALHLLEGAAGYKSRNMTYYQSRGKIEYSQIEYARNFTSVKTLDEFKHCLANKSLALESNYTIHCTPELFDLLIRDDCAWEKEIIKNCGMYRRDMTFNRGKKIINYGEITYYPGFYVAQAHLLGRKDLMTGRLQELHQEAKNILNEFVGVPFDDTTDLQFALQDAIMSRVEYMKSDAEGDHDTAVGALLNGRCECDGYADAFYLLANMAGFRVGFQTGESLDDAEPHLWNIIEHGGQWFFTDLTWCDTTSGVHHHLYANIGRDIAAESYAWADECSLVSLAPHTLSNYYYYSREGVAFERLKDAVSYVEKQWKSGNKHVEVLVAKPAGESIEVLVNQMKEALNIACRFNYKYTDDMVSFIFYPKPQS